MTSRSGSVQVVEFSYVLPIAFTAVVGLLYMGFLLFFYTYSVSVAGKYAEQACYLAEQSDRIYWQLSTDPIDEEDRLALEKELAAKMKRMEVLPGISFRTAFTENLVGTKFQVNISCSYFGKQLFSVVSARTAYHPREFAKNVDLVEQLAEESDLLSQIKEKYEQYLNREKEYDST
jgi:hypothetical protein